MFDVSQIRKDFPILARKVNGKPLVYLDNGASSQKPEVVIDAVTRAYKDEYANVHRGLHYLSNIATEKYESVRGIVAKFLNASDENEIILNSGTTEGINMVAYGWAMEHMKKGDNIVLSVMEHHANIVPWHFLRERMGIELKWVDIDDDGNLNPQNVIEAIDKNTKLVAITHMSNVLGTIVDVKTICHEARSLGVATLIDGSQGAVHLPINVQNLGCDFYPITGHKLCGPTGSGAIYVRAERMAEMRPFLGGGDMIKEVHADSIIYNDAPMKFEAGTPGIVQTIGFGVALNYIMQVGLKNIAEYEAELKDYALKKLTALNWIKLQGQPKDKGAIFSFTMDNLGHAHDISTILDKKGIAVRAGQHCAGPLMDHMGITASCRASFAFYNTKAEVDTLVDALQVANDLLS